MKNSLSRWYGTVIALILVAGAAACSAEEQASAEIAEAPEMASADGREPTSSEADGGASLEGGDEHARSEEREEHGAREGGEEHRPSEGRGEHEGSDGEGEHSGEEGGHDEGGEEGEESGIYIGVQDTWDVTRRGARLVLAFEAATDRFKGTVENTTEDRLCSARVEVHLSTGTELGPTARMDLPAGETMAVELPTGGEAFDAWTAHPEMSPCGE